MYDDWTGITFDDSFDISDVVPVNELPDLSTVVGGLGDPGWDMSYPVDDTFLDQLTAEWSPSFLERFGGDLAKATQAIKGFLTSDAGKAILGATGIAAGMSKYGQPSGGGWKGTVPTNLVATRTQIEQPEYTPYSKSSAPVMGRRFFSDIQYSKPGTSLPAETSIANSVSSDLSKIANQNTQAEPQGAAQGGIMKLAQGRYLRGSTDGMADKIPSSIEGKQPAALSHGEFVIPADVVSHLGNGNSDAGAKVLYNMMDRVRQARTGTKKQGKQINPQKFMPGGIAQLASGGAVKRFQTGGSTGTTGSATGLTLANPLGGAATGAVQEGNLSNWVGDYVGDVLGRGLAMSKEPFQAYTGPVTAGVSPVQQQAFTQAQGIAGTQFDPSKFMNPYLSGALQPQLDALRREAEISQQKLQGQFAKAGAFGGARDVIARTENLRNLGDLQAKVTGQGYKDAYDRAMDAFFKEQSQEVTDLGALLRAGQEERNIEQEGINALRAQFEEERQDPFTKLTFAKSLLGGLPVGTQVTDANLSPLQRLGLSATTISGPLLDFINRYLTDSEKKTTTPEAPVADQIG